MVNVLLKGAGVSVLNSYLSTKESFYQNLSYLITLKMTIKYHQVLAFYYTQMDEFKSFHSHLCLFYKYHRVKTFSIYNTLYRIQNYVIIYFECMILKSILKKF